MPQQPLAPTASVSTLPRPVYELLELANGCDYAGRVPEHLKDAFDFARASGLIWPHTGGFLVTDEGTAARTFHRMSRMDGHDRSETAETAPAAKPAKAPRQPRKRKPRTELTERQQFVYELRTNARLSFARIAERLSEHFPRPDGKPCTKQAAEGLYRRAKTVLQRRGRSVQAMLSLHPGA